MSEEVAASMGIRVVLGLIPSLHQTKLTIPASKSTLASSTAITPNVTGSFTPNSSVQLFSNTQCSKYERRSECSALRRSTKLSVNLHFLSAPLDVDAAVRSHRAHPRAACAERHREFLVELSLNGDREIDFDGAVDRSCF